MPLTERLRFLYAAGDQFCKTTPDQGKHPSHDSVSSPIYSASCPHASRAKTRLTRGASTLTYLKLRLYTQIMGNNNC